MLIDCYNSKRKFTESEKLLRKALRLHPTHIWLLSAEAFYYIDQDQFDEAMDVARRIVRASPLSNAYAFLAAVAWSYANILRRGRYWSRMSTPTANNVLELCKPTKDAAERAYEMDDRNAC